ncbi:MAG: nicotinamide-nucleotide amidohydrolase family protein, partial [Chloroflexi bacterium]|nr:nicotinamide-nucleotide amidohydrolase family protein [Chloroflexota bacterium]
DYFMGAVVSYSNSIKSDVAGVSEATLLLHGAVSAEVASQMATGGKRVLKVDICVSTTGIAGPGGATVDKPVGLFYIGLSTASGVIANRYIFSGKREEIKRKAVETALALVKEYLQKCLDETASAVLEEKHVVTCFLEQSKLILLLRRSGRVGTYKRAWAGVSGYIETDALDQAVTEIREETGLFNNNIKLVRQGKPLEVIDKSLHRKWIVHPFLFHVLDPQKIMLDWEHTEFTWVKPKDLKKYKTVPGLAEALKTVLD